MHHTVQKLHGKLRSDKTFWNLDGPDRSNIEERCAVIDAPRTEHLWTGTMSLPHNIV